LDVVMPPIPESEDWRDDGRVGTEGKTWRIFRASVCGKAGLMRVKGKVGNGVDFPELAMDGLWGWVANAKMECETVDED
jgi:hypothetical protein